MKSITLELTNKQVVLLRWCIHQEEYRMTDTKRSREAKKFARLYDVVMKQHIAQVVKP